MQYTVREGKCTKTPLSGEIPTFGVLPRAKYDYSEYIGASLPNLGVLVHEYHDIVREHSIYGSSYAPVNAEGTICIPIMVSTLEVKPGLAMELI